ncbi:hypothetical protein RJ639_032085 [Escallonia herrerae]|uniref:Uncharacterized protein n=1 Tax=Escallonia herrerae TaxID=1293975 RepID=A0AA88WZU2_9ASTE|nr:hypothetical protein RJ639_032085 [Escallonia herrerae]
MGAKLIVEVTSEVSPSTVALVLVSGRSATNRRQGGRWWWRTIWWKEGRKGLGGNVKGGGRKLKVRSMKHPIGKGMEVTMIGKGGNGEYGKKDRGGRGLSRSERKGSLVKRTDKSKWVFGVDEKSGEEHIFRVPRSL